MADRKKHSRHRQLPDDTASGNKEHVLEQIERCARAFLVRRRKDATAERLRDAIAEGIARMVERYPQWETLPFQKLTRVVIGTASNWLRDSEKMLPLSALFPPDPEMGDPNFEGPGSETLDPSELVASSYDIVWILQHFDTEELVIILARWLDFRYEDIAMLIRKSPDAVKKRHQRLCHRVRSLLTDEGYCLPQSTSRRQVHR